MEECVKITHSSNLNKFNFSLTISMPIDSNANVKKILDINSYLFDSKVECGNGKAIMSGKIGVKVLYLDTDNMTNTLSETSSFSETYLDSSLTSNTHLNMSNLTITNNVLSTEGTLKINCEVGVKPVAYLNLALPNNLEVNDRLITKKCQVATNSITEFVNSSFDYTVTLEPKDKLNKILCHNGYFAVEKTTAENGYVVVEGKLVSTLVYEATNNDETLFKTMKEVSNVKCDVELSGATKESLLDLNFALDKSLEEISTEMEDGTSLVNIKNVIKICGVILKPVLIDVVDDLYSTSNEVELTLSKREYTKTASTYTISENISNEVSLQDDEPAIDEVVSNLNQNAEITNTYIKNDTIFIEGVVSSNLVYIDENKEFKNKLLEIPFIINTKIVASNLGCVNTNISVIDSKVKVKRGTNIDVEYSLFITLTVYEKETYKMVDNLTMGKLLDFTKYDYQIFLAKPQETTWDLCKRIKICPEDLVKLNKNLPLVMEGGEKVVIKR